MLVSDPVKSRFDVPCTIFGTLPLLLWNQLINLFKVTSWVIGAILFASKPRQNIINVL